MLLPWRHSERMKGESGLGKDGHQLMPDDIGKVSSKD